MASNAELHTRGAIVTRLHSLAVVAVATLIMLASAAAADRASAAVISFDDLSAPAPGGQGLTVNVQYAGQGVTFNDLDAFNYPVGFAHSPNVGVEPCFAIEFCQAPARANFTAPQDYVRVWVGYNGPLASPLPVTLTAFDAASTQLGVAGATLPANASPTPIQTSLALDPPGATITRIEVSTESGFTGGLAIDDVEFSTEGPPPPCSATSVPTVALGQPPGGLVVHNNQFLLRGSVATNGAPITSATVVAQSPTTRTATAYPSLIDADGGQFGPVNFNGLLSSGVNDVVVTATNCLGTGTSVARRVTLSPIAPGTQFKQFGMIEINQAVQDPFNAVPLVAAGPTTTKRTFARVYLGLQGGSSSISSVTGRLTASRPDGSLPGGPVGIQSLNTITVDAASTAESARSSLASSLNFELPPEWLAEGRLHLQLDRLEIEGAQSALDCLGCDNPFPSGAPAVKTFHAVPPVRIWLVRVPYAVTPGAASTVPTQFDINMLASWLRRAYPTAEVRDTQMFMPVQDGPPGFVDEDDDGIDENRDGFLCTDVNSELSEWTQSMQAQAPNTRYYGVVSDAGGNFMRGCAQIGGRFGSGPAGPGTFGWDNDGAYTDWYGGHEIGHMYNRKHPGICGETDDDDSFPFGGGLIGNSTFDAQGLDAGDSTLGPPLQLNDWRDGWSDLMTYCDNQWISDYSYRGILKNLCGAEKANCPNHPELTSAGSSPRRARSSSTPAALRKGGGPRLAVSGSLKLSSGKLKLAPLSVLRGLTLSQRPRRSPYAIELVGRRGRVLGRYPFEPKVEADLPAGYGEAAVDEVVRFDPATRRVEITKGKKVLRSIPVSSSAPKVALTSPKGGKKLSKRVKVRWRSRDADGDRLTYSLLYSHDGKHFVPIASGLRKRSFQADLRQLPGGAKARFRVVATDGVLTGTATSRRSFKVPAKSPSVLISAPEAGADFVEGRPIQFVASVDDLQDPQIPAKRVVWRSNLQGELGKGATILASLDPGNHEVTVTVTNSAGKKTVATVTVDVAAVPPSVDAILIGP